MSSNTECWKNSVVTSILKRKNVADFQNYRPPSIISILPKETKDLISKKITHLFKNTFLNNQYISPFKSFN